MLSAADIALSLVSGAVLVVGLMVMLTALYTALNERRREIAVLRTLGIRTRQIIALFVLESTLISAAGAALGVAAAYGLLLAVRTPVENHYGIPLAMVGISARIVYCMAAVVGAGALLGLIPAFRAYRNALVDGLNAG